LLRDHWVRLGQLGALVARHSPYAELARRRERLAGLSARLNAGHVSVLRREAERTKASTERLKMVHERLRRAYLGGLVQRRNAVLGLTKLFASFDHRSVLARGFALVRAGEGGQLVRSVTQIAPGQALSIELADGRAFAIADGEGPAPASSAPMRPRAPAKTASKIAPKTQGDLF
jgi:exodeoxyribonuclease VII large subunit